jgi:hypothetical protein
MKVHDVSLEIIEILEYYETLIIIIIIIIMIIIINNKKGRLIGLVISGAEYAFYGT